MPCSAPLLINGQKVGCRSCNYCVGRRVRGWVVRAMMEKAMWPNSFAVALTYDEKTEESRRGARMFDYRGIELLNKRLREHMSRATKREENLSFIACGEQGERFKRCHWHLLYFSNVDFCSLGEWRAPWGVVTRPEEIISAQRGEVHRRVWSLWPHGYVTVQQPDYGGMRYAMSYALKDQFNVRNAEGTARHHRAEVFATGYLSVSKKPAIGERFVRAYLEQCRVAGLVPPTRSLAVPGCDHPWRPVGRLADILLDGFAAINAEVRLRTGRDAAGWSSLLYEARDSEGDLETLGNYDEQAAEQDEDPESGDAYLRVATAERERDARRREARRRCGSTEACSLCLRGRGDLASIGIIEEANGAYRREGGTERDFQRAQRDNKGNGPNRLCCLYGCAESRAGNFADIFPNHTA